MAFVRFTRREFFDLIWSKPMRDVAADLGFSDVAVRKAALRAGLPLPPRGHWNRIAAGKKGFPKPALSPRGFGASDEVTFGADPWSWTRRVVDIGPEPKAPEFDETMDEVRERAAGVIGKVGVPRDLERCHPAVRRMLAEEEDRASKARERPYWASQYAPRLAAPGDKRRLRIANAIALAVARADVKASMHDVEGVAVGYGSYHDGWICVSVVARQKPKRGEGLGGLQVDFGKSSPAKFVDGVDAMLESRIAEIALEIVVEVEARYRASALSAHARAVKEREDRIEEARLAKLEAERKERERQEALERARVERLLGQAERLRQADAIRAFVAEVRRRVGAVSRSDDLGAWSAWALAQADRLDPTRDLSVLLQMEDE